MPSSRSQNDARQSQRLFVACDVPEAAAAAVADWQHDELDHAGNVRTAASIHLTLCFLGGTPQDAIPRITQTLGEIRFKPACVTFAPPIFLPEHGHKRVIALGLRPSPADPAAIEHMAALQQQVSAALAALGVYTPEKRAWLPHVTVARFRQPGQPFPLQNVNLQELCVSRMVLYTSVLARGGAVHTPLAVFTAQ
jgi:RNA 2',3'-cyclic 3'-phosphodiesterase